MTQFPKELRQWLSDNCVISLPTLITESVSPDGKTRKILVEMTDQSRVEAVLMEQHYGYSVCVSSQVGCAMGCVFCASTQGGLYRDLTVSEIIWTSRYFRSSYKRANPLCCSYGGRGTITKL